MFMNAKMYLDFYLHSIVLIDLSCHNGVGLGDTFVRWLNLFDSFISLYRASLM